MFSSVLSATILGIESFPVQVEADVSDGLPTFHMVGYLSAQVKEAHDRVKTAIRNIGIVLPPKRITINLSPADIRKEGTGFDLPIAIAVLTSLGIIKRNERKKVLVVGELSLDGTVNPITGILPIVVKAKNIGCSTCVIPEGNLPEGSVISGIQVVGVKNIKEAIEYLSGGKAGRILTKDGQQFIRNKEGVYDIDFSDIQGQKAAKRAAVIAVSGFHNLLMIGPPGAAKTMIAKRMPTILPMLTLEESIEISQIHSIAGLLSPDHPLLYTRPFRSPHHTLSPQALSGGGFIPKPGEITLAHKGVLFLDELTEFSQRSLEILRQPLEDREIFISRIGGTFRFPANLLLVAAMNPCVCGYYPDMNRCTCMPADISRYLKKISKPLLDRIDICVEASEVSYQEISNQKKEKTSKEIREEVMLVHQIQKERYQGTGIQFNSELREKDIHRYCPMDAKAEMLLKKAFRKMNFSARIYHRILKTARTIADLEQKETIQEKHMSEAICFRMADTKYWKR